MKSPISTLSKQDKPLKMDELFMFLPRYKVRKVVPLNAKECIETSSSVSSIIKFSNLQFEKERQLKDFNDFGSLKLSALIPVNTSLAMVSMELPNSNDVTLLQPAKAL